MISIRRQLTRNLLGVFLLLLGGALAAFYFAARDEVQEQFDDALRTKAIALSSLTVSKKQGIRIEFTDELFHSFSKNRPRDFFELWRADGSVVARSESLGETDLALPNIQQHRERFWNLPLPNGRLGRAMALTFALPQDEHDDGPPQPKVPLTLVVASDREGLDEVLTELLSIGALCEVLLLGATIFVVPRVLRKGLQPLDQLGEQTSRIDAASLTSRFPCSDLPVELQPIAGRLNELLARLETSFERERRFSADLAHELRTPLAELRSLAECSLKWPDSRDAATDQENLAIAAQMQSIVVSLLALARGEQQLLSSSNETVDLPAFAQQIWRTFAERAAQRQLRVQWIVGPAMVQADPALLRSILTNLFDNAVDYAPTGGELTISIDSTPAGTALRMSNPSENLNPDDVPKLFDRFWRKEEARSGGRHFGLGLSLARMFAQAMGWTLTASMSETKRLEFTFASPGTVSPTA